MSKPELRYRTEKHFQTAVLKRLKTIPNSWWIKVHDLSTFGLPDILGCVGGTFVALELKNGSSWKVTPLQAHTLKKIEAANGYAKVVYPDEFDSVFEELSSRSW